MQFTIHFWLGFIIFLCIALTIDLGIAHKKPKQLSFKESSTAVGVWILLASLFCTLIFYYGGQEKALEFITGYVIEFSLSMDNVFIFVLIFSYFKVPTVYQHRVLFWGILGAIVMRLIMITGGIYLFQKVDWILYIFGAILIYSGFKIAVMKNDDENLGGNSNFIIKFLKKYFNVSETYHGQQFIAVDETGRRVITPLLVVLIFIEKTDLIFALDSIPAIIAVTKDPFIIFTSNIFAILGLRSLYFMLINLMERFVYLKFGISLILIFVGFKMIASMWGIHINIEYSLLTIIGILITSVVASLILTRTQK